MARWRALTGENRVKASDPRVVLLGDRSMLWLDDAEQSEFAQLEEPFAVIHKCTLQGILEERKRDAAPQPGRRRSARKLLAED